MFSSSTEPNDLSRCTAKPVHTNSDQCPERASLTRVVLFAVSVQTGLIEAVETQGRKAVEEQWNRKARQ